MNTRLYVECHTITADNSTKVTFPRSFPNNCIGIAFVDINNGAYYHKLVSMDRYGFIKNSITISNGSVMPDIDTFRYIAIGY